jgi:hypothetical protein
MFRAVALTLLLSVASYALPASAQSAAPSDDTHFTAALELMEATNAKTTMLAMIDTMAPLVLNQIRAQRPNVSTAALQQFQAAFREEMMDDMDDLIKATARLYEEHFTESELRTVTEFYRSDVGKKYIGAMPALLKESVPLGAAWGKEAGARAAQRAAERLRANGVDL